MSSGSCAVCRAPASQCCSGCRVVFYCGRDHQKQHWRQHKTQCSVYKISVSEVLGRHLEATRDIKAGEVILQERPLAVGPKVVSFPVCLGCHKWVTVNGDSWHTCSGCGWPMCGPQCELLPMHVTECKLMRENNFKACIPHDNKKEAAYCSITPLRCLLLKDKDPVKYKAMFGLQSHLEERRNTTLYTIFRNNIVGFIRNALKLEQFDEETILRVAAILDTNSFEVRYNKVRVRALYPTAAMMSHDCRPNTKHVFKDQDYTLVLIATVPIKKGDYITATYTQTLWGTLARRAHLKISKCFDCACARCSDPTELGTYLGAIRCAKCKQIGDSDNKMISTSPLDSAAPWKCQSCSHTIAGRQMAWGNDAIRQEIEALDKSKPEPMEDFLDKYSGALHPFNSHVVEVKYSLVQLYGNLQGYSLSELSDKLVARKVELCSELLELTDALDPGMSRIRGGLLYDLQAVMVIQAKRDLEADKITKARAQDVMSEAMTLLQEATEILQKEPNMAEELQEKLSALTKELDIQ